MSKEASQRWRSKNPNYDKEYRTKNLDKIIQKDREYYALNKDEIRASRNQKYRENDAYRDSIKIEWKKRYETDKDVILARNKQRFLDRRESVHRIAMHYGCQNPECKWTGGFMPCQLHFHHIDPTIKIAPISQLTSYSTAKLVAEINKCMVLCACCHIAVTYGHYQIYDPRVCRIDEQLLPIEDLVS